MVGILVTYSLAYGGIFVALGRPFYGVVAYVALAVLRPSQLWPWAVPDRSYSEMLGIAVFIGWVIHGCSMDIGKRGKTFIGLFFAFWAWSVMSYLASGQSALGNEFVTIILKILIPCFIGVATCESIRDVRILAWTLAVSLSYIAYIEHSNYYGYGLKEGDNSVAQIMSLGAVIATFLAFDKTPWYIKGGLFFGAALMVHAVLFHMSRGGMLGLLVLGMFFVKYVLQNPKYLGLLAIGVAVTLYLAGDSVQEEFASIFAGADDRDESAQSRFDLWRDMWTVALENPILGIGPQHWMLISSSFGWSEGKAGHGTPQQLACELGIPGSMLWLGVFLWCPIVVYLVGIAPRNLNRNDLRPFFFMGAAGLFSWFVMQLVTNAYFVELPYYVLMLSAMTLKVFERQECQTSGQQLEGIAEIFARESNDGCV